MTMTSTKEDLVSAGVRRFQQEFSSRPEWCGTAPARVNLIGEHTDYNKGYVLPMALPLVTVVIGKRSDTKMCNVVTMMIEAEEECRVNFKLPSQERPLTPGQLKWANYVKGVVANFQGPLNFGFDCVIASNVPIGGGLSSSASLEVAMYTFLEAITETENDGKTKAFACQKAENDFAHVPCGVMDQFISVMGREKHALLIDCRSMETIAVPLNDERYVFLIVNSNVHHELCTSAYAERRQTCFHVAAILNKESLRDATLYQIENLLAKGLIDELTFKRARHVITEIQRTLKAAEALTEGNFNMFGQFMFESHCSLRDDYQVSCEELDKLVELVRPIPGVLGSRMTGGGFGGCTVTLIDARNVEQAQRIITENYSGNPSFYTAIPSTGSYKCVLC